MSATIMKKKSRHEQFRYARSEFENEGLPPGSVDHMSLHEGGSVRRALQNCVWVEYAMGCELHMKFASQHQ